MPASVSAACIEETLRSSLDIKGTSLSQKLISSSKKVLLHKIDFSPAQSTSSFQIDNLRAKYTSLNPSKTQANGKNSNDGNKETMTNLAEQEDSSGGLPPPRVVLYNPDKVRLEWPRIMKIGSGLSNLGNTCFLNATLQCLTYTAPLYNYFVTEDHAKKCNIAGFCMLCELQRHVQRCFEGHQVIRPQVILQKLKLIAKNMRYGNQEDAHEFLRHVVDSMHKSCLFGQPKTLDRLSKETTVVNQIFGGFLRSQVICMMCKAQSNTYDQFLDLSLDVKNGTTTIQRALDKFVEVENLDVDNAYNCGKCKRKVRAQKRMTVHKESNVLTIQLKRFASLFGGKINRHIQFTERLNLRPYMSQKQGEPIWYQLYAVLVHSGFSCNSGHYYCYVKNSTGTWHIMNDSSVQAVNAQRVMCAEAYLLFYIKVQTNDPAPPNGPAPPKSVPKNSTVTKPCVKLATVNAQEKPLVNGPSAKPSNINEKVKKLSIQTNVPLKISQPPKVSPIKAPAAAGSMKSPPLRSPPASIITPTNPMKGAPTVVSPNKPSAPATAIPSQREKLSFSIRQKQPESAHPTVVNGKKEQPKIVMVIKNGKVSYNSVSPTGEKLKPTFAATPGAEKKVMKRLVDYDEDDDTESDIDADKVKAQKVEPKSMPSTVSTSEPNASVAKVSTPMTNGVTDKTSIKPAPSAAVKCPPSSESVRELKQASNGLFEPVLDSRLNATTEVPGAYGSLNKGINGSKSDSHSEANSSRDPRSLKKSLSHDGSLSVHVPMSEHVKAATNATTRWQVLEQEAKSPSLASSSGSVNSTSAGWNMCDEAAAKRHIVPEAQHCGWKVMMSPDKSQRSGISSAPADTSETDAKTTGCNTPRSFQSKDDSFLKSSSLSGAHIKTEPFSPSKSAHNILPANIVNEMHSPKKTFKKEEVVKEEADSTIDDTMEDKVSSAYHDSVPLRNGHADSMDSSEVSDKKKKKKKKKRKHRESENTVTTDTNDTTATITTTSAAGDYEPPKKKHKKKKKKKERPDEPEPEPTIDQPASPPPVMLPLSTPSSPAEAEQHADFTSPVREIPIEPIRSVEVKRKLCDIIKSPVRQPEPTKHAIREIPMERVTPVDKKHTIREIPMEPIQPAEPKHKVREIPLEAAPRHPPASDRKRKHHHHDDNDLEEGELCDEDTASSGRSRKHSAKHGPAPATVPVQSWDHHVKDGFKQTPRDTGASGDHKTAPAWDGVRRSKPSTVRELERAGRKVYGAAVSAWGGGDSALDELSRRERLMSHADRGGWDEEYEAELDAGRVKKVKRHSDPVAPPGGPPGHRGDHNPFQRQYEQQGRPQHHGGAAPPRRKSWHNDYNRHRPHGNNHGNSHSNNHGNSHGNQGHRGNNWQHGGGRKNNHHSNHHGSHGYRPHQRHY